MLKTLVSRMSRIAELIAAIILAAIFITFLLQIFTRYAPKLAWLMPIPSLADWMTSLVPIGWTVNLISLLWVWLIFIGCSFVVRDRDHVIFDVFYSAVSPKWQKYFTLATSFILIAVMIYALAPTYDAIFGNMLMSLKKIQTLRIPITGDKVAVKWLFAPIILFMAATIIRYGIRCYRVLSSGHGDHDHDMTSPQGTPPRDKGDAS